MTDIYKNLEFNIILGRIAELASSDVVADEIRNTLPNNDESVVNKLLTQTNDAVTVLASHCPSFAFDDILPILSKAKVGATLSPKELLKVGNVIVVLRALKDCVEHTDGCDSLKDITSEASVCAELEYDIRNAIENETEIKDSASEKLTSVRRAILRANARLKDKLDSYTRQSEFSKYLQDNIVTLRGGRYVLPVRSECRSNVKGLGHDVSASGSTVFIEPFAVVEANNELITLKTEEFNEIERILCALSKKVVTNADALVQSQYVLTECGVIFAKAEYAKKTDSCRPIVNIDGKITLKGARHPLIDTNAVVPVDIDLNDKRILLISGPNTGGKTVALKTVGLFALMTMCGMFIPVLDGSEMSVFDDIYCDIGDSQSIAQSLSTFSAHVTNLAKITSNMNKSSLVLLDEVGDGTDPDEGAALAVAIIKKLLTAQATAVVTTHFNSVKEFALACDGVANASMQFDSENLKPTYRLLQGVSGSSYALEIAERLGLGKDIIADAKRALSAEKIAFDKVMREVEKLRNSLYEEKLQAEAALTQASEQAAKTSKLKSEYENKLAEINDNARIIIKRKADEYAEQAESIIEEIKEQLKTANETALFNARKSSKKIYDGVPVDEVKPDISNTPPNPNELKIGTRVFISGLNKEGVIAGSLRGNKAVVAVGSIKTEIPIASLSLINERQKAPNKQNNKREIEPENREVMMLGLTVDEAVGEIDRILSDIAPHSVLRIVHGKGTGALGKGIQSFLKRQSRVKSYRYGRYGEGDTGVTIVEIK
ncbi:endonuclease MutS2 [Anaerocaecibacter muris]|uniref:endonuclease MutS2 n=1 Tax=Anaerocaecibacter muris TaxID=2941513 RepID=UPI003F68D36F